MNEFIKNCEYQLKDIFEELDETAFFNQNKVLNSFQKNNVELRHFYGSTGYGYDDIGKQTICQVFANIFCAQKAIVSPCLTCGTHALFLALSSVLRPGDLMLSISGQPYDTMVDCILGKQDADIGSLKDYGVKYSQVDLKNDTLDEENILNSIKTLKPKLVYLQKSRGYSWRNPISVDIMQNIFNKIKQINKDIIIFVDNCYGEFVEKKEPSEVGADIVVGSLCKNPGGGIVANGAYILGTEKYITLIENRMTAPSIGSEVGSNELGYRLLYQGLFCAPSVVKNALKGSYLLGKVMENLGYQVMPSSNQKSFDIIKSIKFNTEDELIKFVQLVQKLSPVDSNALPYPSEMPGYDNNIIMAAGTFVQGASIEMSCDSPIRKPYIAYFQGGLTYEHIKILAEEVYKIYNK